jgi:hypothetical protein
MNEQQAGNERNETVVLSKEAMRRFKAMIVQQMLEAAPQAEIVDFVAREILQEMSKSEDIVKTLMRRMTDGSCPEADRLVGPDGAGAGELRGILRAVIAALRDRVEELGLTAVSAAIDDSQEASPATRDVNDLRELARDLEDWSERFPQGTRAWLKVSEEASKAYGHMPSDEPVRLVTISSDPYEVHGVSVVRVVEENRPVALHRIRPCKHPQGEG